MEFRFFFFIITFPSEDFCDAVSNLCWQGGKRDLCSNVNLGTPGSKGKRLY